MSLAPYQDLVALYEQHPTATIDDLVEISGSKRTRVNQFLLEWRAENQGNRLARRILQRPWSEVGQILEEGRA